MKFRKGSSGSPKHTEIKAASVGGRDPAPRSVSAQPGPMAGKVRGLSVYKAGAKPPAGYKQ
jgi:hypothetical protein